MYVSLCFITAILPICTGGEGDYGSNCSSISDHNCDSNLECVFGHCYCPDELDWNSEECVWRDGEGDNLSSFLI